jgi:quinoprotein relay system zinc metallohydrolase 2
MAMHRLRWWLLAGALGSAIAGAAPEQPAELVLQSQPLAPGVYHVPGEVAVWGAANRGHVANSGFVVGERCIAVIDSGGSAAAGKALLAAVRRLSALPVCYVINTHVHPDHMLGNVAFVGAGGSRVRTVFVGHHHLAAAMASHGPFYLKALRRDFGSDELSTRVVAPTLAVQDRRELDLGGRVLELRAWPTAHTDSDLTVLDRRSGVLWLGDLVFLDHIPVLDGQLRGWRAVLQSLRDWRVVLAVPGHGPLIRDWPAGSAPTAAYLQGLENDVRAALREGLSLQETVDRLGAPPAGWQLAEDFHRRNVTAAYAELEWSE